MRSAQRAGLPTPRAHTTAIRRLPPRCRLPPTASASAATCSRWYRKHGRDLPWRKTDDPYHILVSRSCCSRRRSIACCRSTTSGSASTRRSRSLADAPRDEVRATWYPLGYNIRPHRLQSIAREAVARHGGQLPSDEATLLSFKGIGAVHRRRDPQLRLRRARGHPRHQRGAGAVPRVRRQGRPQEPRDEEAALGDLRGAGAAASTCSTSTRR